MTNTTRSRIYLGLTFVLIFLGPTVALTGMGTPLELETLLAGFAASIIGTTCWALSLLYCD